jgi:hypothetical protein
MSYDELMAATTAEKHGYMLTIFEQLRDVRIHEKFYPIDLSSFTAGWIEVNDSYVANLGDRPRVWITLNGCYLKPGVVDQTGNARTVRLVYNTGYVSFTRFDRAPESLTCVCTQTSDLLSLSIGVNSEIISTSPVALRGPVMAHQLRYVSISAPSITFHENLNQATLFLKFLYRNIDQEYPKHVNVYKLSRSYETLDYSGDWDKRKSRLTSKS